MKALYQETPQGLLFGHNTVTDEGYLMVKKETIKGTLSPVSLQKLKSLKTYKNRINGPILFKITLQVY